MRKAPVKLAPNPICAATAGTRIRDAKARPVPRSKEAESLDASLADEICMLLMIHLFNV